MPSVLVEFGYISTPDEEQYLLSDAGTTALSNSIYKAFLNYKREHDALSLIHIYPMFQLVETKIYFFD